MAQNKRNVNKTNATATESKAPNTPAQSEVEAKQTLREKLTQRFAKPQEEQQADEKPKKKGLLKLAAALAVGVTAGAAFHAAMQRKTDKDCLDVLEAEDDDAKSDDESEA